MEKVAKNGRKVKALLCCLKVCGLNNKLGNMLCYFLPSFEVKYPLTVVWILNERPRNTG